LRQPLQRQAAHPPIDTGGNNLAQDFLFVERCQRASILTGAAEADRSLRTHVRSGITDAFREASKCPLLG
jgi:hypothetical protein